VEAVGRFDGLNESAEEVDDVFDVAQVAGFDDGVHVAKREGDEGAGDAFSLVEDDVGIRACEAG